MKEVFCKRCGDPIGRGFDTPIDAELCGNCADHCMECGEWDVLEKGRCYGCNETMI